MFAVGKDKYALFTLLFLTLCTRLSGLGQLYLRRTLQGSSFMATAAYKKNYQLLDFWSLSAWANGKAAMYSTVQECDASKAAS